MREALRGHAPEYLIEAAGLGLFMVSAGVFGTLLEAPASPVRLAIEDPFARRVLMGLAMGATAVGIIYSPWGMRSGAHINPAVTLTFARLGKIEPRDAAGYMVAQFVGAVVAVTLVAAILGSAFTEPPVRYVATLPGPSGPGVAFTAEVGISFILMSVILVATNARRLARWTGLLAGGLVAGYIAFEAPLSGMSMNPARTLGSALPGRVLDGLWIYFLAPPIGMLLAAETYARVRGRATVRCAKLHHDNDQRCIFRCGYAIPDPVPPGSPVDAGAVGSG